VKLFALAIAAYALSPIDLISDFTPLVGYLDDTALLPLGIMLVIKMTTTVILDASRTSAANVAAQPVGNIAATVIMAV
jgi:uncharacterized membrane protein YkvA (DUF1232 family)